MAAHPMLDGVWFDKYKVDDAEKMYQEKRAKDISGLVVEASSPSSQSHSAQSGLADQIARARQNIQNTLNEPGVGLGIGVTVDSPELAARLAAVERENAELRRVTTDLVAAVSKLTERVNALDMTSPGASAPAPAKKEAAPADDDDDDDDEVDLFGDDDDDDEEELAQMQAKRKEQEAKATKAKKVIIAKSSILLDVKPWDDETDMNEIEKAVRSVQADGLVWGASKLVPLAYGIKKLQICCVVEDDKIGTDFLEEEITKFEDLVQSVDIAAFNKI